MRIAMPIQILIPHFGIRFSLRPCFGEEEYKMIKIEFGFCQFERVSIQSLSQ